MFNWLGNLFPYSDLHSLNLDWILSKMKDTAAQAAKAVADAANALAQVAEAKAAALSAQTAASNAQTAANDASTNAANAAASATAAVNTANAAQTAAQNAQTAAQNAQETATAANSAAQTAQETATAANNTAQTAQETATAANSKASTLANKFPISGNNIADGGIVKNKFATPRTAIVSRNSLTVPSSQISNLYDVTYTNSSVSAFYYACANGTNLISLRYHIRDGNQSTLKFITLNPVLRTETRQSPAFYLDSATGKIIQGYLDMSWTPTTDTVRLKLNFPETPDFSDITDPKFSIDIDFVYTDISRAAGI